MGDSAGRYGYQAQVSGLRTRADAAPQPRGKEHPQNPDRGGTPMNKRTRAMALILVIVMVLAMLASMVLPYMAA